MGAMSRRSSFRLKRICAKTLGFVMALFLCACGGLVANDRGGYVVPPDLGLDRLMAVPQPFHTDPAQLPLMRTAAGENDVALLAVTGLTPGDREALAKAVSQAAANYDVLVLSEPPERRTHVLEGITSRPAGALAIKWYLHDANGRLMGTFGVIAKTATTAEPLPSALIKQLAKATAANLSGAMSGTAGVMRTPVTAPASGAFTSAEPPKIRIGAVTGAPGNGDVALPIALKAVLDQDEVPLTESVEGTDFTLTAEVSHEPDRSGGEIFAIDWRVLDRKGDVAGQISQSNQIAAHSLDGDWGQTAYDIALGAKQGLYEMIAEIEARMSTPPSQAPPAGPVIPNSVLHPQAR